MTESPVSFARRVCDTMISTFAAPHLPPVGRFHYHQGVFLLGMQMIWGKTRDRRYFEYVKAWVDSMVLDEDHFEFNRDQADDVQPGVLLFDLLNETGKGKYRVALDRLLAAYDGWSRTSEGAYWHKENCPHQVWLDHIYMQGPLACRYGASFEKPELFLPPILHLELVFKHCRDPRTGLLYHAWDESRAESWAEPETGRSPEFWGRSIAWVCAAIPDMLEWLPADHPKRGVLEGFHRELTAAVIRYQDPASGMWFQVVDKGNRKDNWVEHSCSCLFVYGIAKGVRQGHLDPALLEAAYRGWRGIAGMVKIEASGRVEIPEICVGTGVGDYAHYVARPRSVNDLHGAGAFLFACAEMVELID